VPVLDVPLTDPPPARAELVESLEKGKVSALGGRAAVNAIERAVALALEGAVAGIATAPINKEALREAGCAYIGHTEMLAGMAGGAGGFTMFQVDRMRIFFHSRHTSLRDAIDGLTVPGVADSLKQAHNCLRAIGLKKPRLALAALNPHGSDGGLFGDEEQRILVPACAAARERGVDVEGPVPADSVFHLALGGGCDGVLSLYHDQGHIAAKTYDFYRTVSVTLGLPFVRTSVDHGTAFGIAWQGKANPLSMTEAILACRDLAGRYEPAVFDE
jgi:4-hydroxythreonine-4-phosphate dehydrogenase